MYLTSWKCYSNVRVFEYFFFFSLSRCQITKTDGTADKYARYIPPRQSSYSKYAPLKNLNRTRVRMKCGAGYKQNRLSELSCEHHTDFKMRKNLETRG